MLQGGGVVTAGTEERTDTVLRDCLGQTEIYLAQPRPAARRCIATVASAGYAGLLDDMLGSLNAYGRCPDALRLVFVVNDDADCVRVATKYHATVIRCRVMGPINCSVQAALLSLPQVVDAEFLLCVDADCLVLGDLRPIFGALEAVAAGGVLVCPEGIEDDSITLGQALSRIYGGSDADIVRLLGADGGEAADPLVVNMGLYAARASGLLAVDQAVRAMNRPLAWLEERPDIWWRDQFLFNLALAKLRCGVKLHPAYNVQLNVQDVEIGWKDGRIKALARGQEVRVLHFSGNGRHKYPEFRGIFARIEDPPSADGADDSLDRFLDALRAWLGRLGQSRLAWSFYGTADGQSGAVADAGFPLLGLLHYLVRSNGCVRVLETGTYRGISGACLASAVCHRDGGRVVTFDFDPTSDRLSLWDALPARMRDCIEQRAIDSLSGMRQALERGERYEAALLDSEHSADHVWAEFELARQLVCNGGLILIHDALWEHGSVEGALQRIRDAGFGVVRLWAAESGVREDDRLGLAVVENRRQPRQRVETD
jgi:predicted O-methyltransferase YrrM